MKRSEVRIAQERAAVMLQACKIELTAQEKENIEVAGFGLDELEVQGLELITYVNTDRYCAKELLLFPTKPARSICIPRLAQIPVRWKPSVVVGAKYSYM